MGRKQVEVRITRENVHEALRKGDMIQDAEELGVVVSARPSHHKGADNVAMVYFMGGDCERESFGVPQTLTVLRDENWPEYEAVGRPIGTHVMVEISKAGGGTVGKRYQGTWSYRITQNGKVVAEGDDLRTGTPKTHEEAARIAWEFQDESYTAEH